MNPNAPYPTSPSALVVSLWTHRSLIKQLTKREIKERYRGSFLGLAWSFLNPLLMLSIYTFVFSFVFKVRWGINIQNNQTEFALILFIGLIFHSLLAEVISRAPTQLLMHQNYVKKVVFPLEILSVVSVATAIFHLILSFSVLFIAMCIFAGKPTALAVLTPLTIIPIIPLLLGLGWVFSAMGVYIRDISQFIGLTVTALMFLAPIFYPISAFPVDLQIILHTNPLTIPIIETRKVVLFGSHPNWNGIAVYWIFSLSVCYIGFWIFQKSRRGFADVV